MRLPVPLPDGRVVVSGGIDGFGCAPSLQMFSSGGALLWDTALATWNDLNGNQQLDPGEYLRLGGWTHQPVLIASPTAPRLVSGNLGSTVVGTVQTMLLRLDAGPTSPQFVEQTIDGPGASPAIAACQGVIGAFAAGPNGLFALGEALCYANCDGSTAAPALNVNDFRVLPESLCRGREFRELRWLNRGSRAQRQRLRVLPEPVRGGMRMRRVSRRQSDGRRGTQPSHRGPVTGGHSAFTLVELLVVISVVALLLSLLAPSLAGARDSARTGACLSNQRQLAAGWMMYAGDFDGRAMPLGDAGTMTYWWGALVATPALRVEHERGYLSPYLDAGLHERSAYECPAQPWGTYRPQPAAVQLPGAPTSTYGYNGYYLCPPMTPGWSSQIGAQPWKRISDIERPTEVLVFADTLLEGNPARNNALLDPPKLYSGGGQWAANPFPTTCFRHGRGAGRRGWVAGGWQRAGGQGGAGVAHLTHAPHRERGIAERPPLRPGLEAVAVSPARCRGQG
jgi:prepilin-type N-terminal cleavage/methylation domain-containing protein